MSAPPPPEPLPIEADLTPGPDGIWYPAALCPGGEPVSYPGEGNQNCLALEADSFWFRHRSDCILAALRRFPPPGLLWDVGGGNGYVALHLLQAGVPAALLEPGVEGARSAYRRGIRPVICATLQEAGFQAGSLPAVGLFDVLEHMEADSRFLAEVYRLLAPGGRLYLTVPAYRVLWSADDDYAGHFRRYTLSGLRQTLRRAGFEIDFRSYFFFFLPVPIFFLRAVPTWLGLRKQNAWDSYRQEHGSRSGLLGRLLEAFLSLELSFLKRARSLPVGGSCLIVARKPISE